MAWDYRSRHDSLPDAKAAITGDPGGHGGVIVERPRDMFHIYKTNPLEGAKDNLKETKIDASDSREMVLGSNAARHLRQRLGGALRRVRQQERAVRREP